MSAPIVVLRPDDAARIATVHQAATENAWPVQDYRKMLSDSAHICLGIIATDGSTLAAFALCQTVADTADLLMVATHPRARRSGHARTLLRALLKRLGERGTDKLMLDVAADNSAAIALYQALNFDEDGQRPKYYRRGDERVDAILMSRPVAGLLPREKA